MSDAPKSFRLPRSLKQWSLSLALTVGGAAAIQPGALHAADATAAPAPATAEVAAPKPAVVLPMQRLTYFVGEMVPLAVSGPGELALAAVRDGGAITPLYKGPAGPLWFDTTRLAPGQYALTVNGETATPEFVITSPVPSSMAVLNDESLPSPTKDKTLAQVAATLRETGLTGAMSMGNHTVSQDTILDTMARTGMTMMVNPDTRPTSFLPVGADPAEIAGMSQRMALMAAANSRYPNFAGFCYGWDTTGYAISGRRMLLTYWAWGSQTENVRAYIDRQDAGKMADFTAKTGLAPVTGEEYIAYLLAMGLADQGPMIDLTTRNWLKEIGPHLPKMSEADRKAFETRLDAWSRYLMSLYGTSYSAYQKALQGVDPALRNSSSVQVDHCPVLYGQYFPSAYAPLDFRYQSTWNDQVGGPDYLYQGLFVASMLEMERGRQPVWISNTHVGALHGDATYPGHMAITGAHILAHGGTGLGFALEGFSNLTGGMRATSNWDAIKGKFAAEDVRYGKAFMDRFAPLAIAGGEHGVGILFSQSQYARQYTTMGYGTPAYRALVTLTRLGYTPRFVTENELATGKAGDVQALVVIGQTAPLPEAVQTGLAAYQQAGGKVLVDTSTTEPIPGAGALGMTFTFTPLGKPHSWSSPNLIRGENDTVYFERQYPALAKGFDAALGTVGRGWMASARGVESEASLVQLQGGTDARFVLAINDARMLMQGDWMQFHEPLVVRDSAPAGLYLYDCTAEVALGAVREVNADLATTPVRVYALLTREAGPLLVSGSQRVAAGDAVTVRIQVADTKGAALHATVPLRVSLIAPDGTAYQSLDRASNDAGILALTLPIGANAATGDWKLEVHNRLNGETAALPVTVGAARNPATQDVRPLADTVVVRNRAAIADFLKAGQEVLIPTFHAAPPALAKGQPAPATPPAPIDTDPAAVAAAQTLLAGLGVKSEVRPPAKLATYTIGYTLTPEQAAENATVESGDAIGAVKRVTLNGNDWAGGQSGFEARQPMLLLDLTTQTGDNPLAESLARLGALWPAVTVDYPGDGRAVVQAVPWAFSPGVTTVIIQARDSAGLVAGVQALANLPEDHFTDRLAAVKTEMWSARGIGAAPETIATPATAETATLTTAGLTHVTAADPLVMAFPNGQPPTAETRKVFAYKPLPVEKVPATYLPKSYVLEALEGDAYVETETVSFLMPDLRFSDAVRLIAEVDAADAGDYTITARGQFRYNDRTPCWQAQWEDLIALRDKYVPKTRLPLVFDVQVDGKDAGQLTASEVVTATVPLELRSSSAGMKPKTADEEIVAALQGKITLPAGRHEIRLIQRNVVDGRLDKVEVLK